MILFKTFGPFFRLAHLWLVKQKNGWGAFILKQELLVADSKTAVKNWRAGTCKKNSIKYWRAGTQIKQQEKDAKAA